MQLLLGPSEFSLDVFQFKLVPLWRLRVPRGVSSDPGVMCALPLGFLLGRRDPAGDLPFGFHPFAFGSGQGSGQGIGLAAGTARSPRAVPANRIRAAVGTDAYGEESVLIAVALARLPGPFLVFASALVPDVPVGRAVCYTGRAGCRLAPPAVDPEAFSDFHGDHPFIELRDPADITRAWRPGSGITDRLAATTARLQADLRSRASSAQ